MNVWALEGPRLWPRPGGQMHKGRPGDCPALLGGPQRPEAHFSRAGSGVGVWGADLREAGAWSLVGRDIEEKA